jgi:hypothetical protein
MFRHVTLRSEPALMLRWDKGAEACYDDAGALQIWTPDIVTDEDKSKEILASADASKWRCLLTAGGKPYGVQPRETADRIAELCDRD